MKGMLLLFVFHLRKVMFEGVHDLPQFPGSLCSVRILTSEAHTSNQTVMLFLLSFKLQKDGVNLVVFRHTMVEEVTGEWHLFLQMEFLAYRQGLLLNILLKN